MQTTLALERLSGQRTTKNRVEIDWIDAQEGRYRYLVHEDASGIHMRIAIGENWYADVLWAKVGGDA